MKFCVSGFVLLMDFLMVKVEIPSLRQIQLSKLEKYYYMSINFSTVHRGSCS